jgi:hypothetical protein
MMEPVFRGLLRWRLGAKRIGGLCWDAFQPLTATINTQYRVRGRTSSVKSSTLPLQSLIGAAIR